MNEDDLLLKLKPTWYERIRWQTWLSVISFVVSVLSGLFTWQLVRIGDRQAKAAEHQASTADQALKDAKETSASQKSDVERARKAAESSAQAAQKLAEGMIRSATAAESSAQAGRQALSLNLRSLILSNQPDVEIADLRLKKALTPNEKPVVTARIYNPGRGRAIEMEARGWINLSNKLFFVYQKIDPPPSIVDLPSNNGSVQNELELPSPLSTDLIAAIENGAIKLYTYGLVDYYDNTLEKPRQYTLHWCGVYNPKTQDKLLMSLCGEHNFTTSTE